MYYIGLDVHKRTISYCVKEGSGAISAEGTIPATRFDLDRWMKTLPRPFGILFFYFVVLVLAQLASAAFRALLLLSSAVSLAARIY
jgi:hypothetical protein